MKKLISSVALVAFVFSSSVFAQEVKEEKKDKKEKMEKTCSKGDKKACTDKKACCTKKAEKKA
ncbi:MULTISPECIES: hypothetical protein [Flavobacterium]|uniref:Uncharacterized protein n=2 Tax=Flavobacterium TaxID=237 RepID=A0AA94EYJ5_9FLAO|nr:MULTISPECIES: hypothetical protein [Flavobacterium]OXA75244.1 hypothetical protein B0A56_11345 [Flavobacterium columnare NBRC 100251 = ATCC 23463]AMA49134.1 hypothetical protein AWN65_06505 [Flavobacterium covae]AND64795.1 hypothetical protein AX766_10525 [Flavobacterium covae]MCH4831064.1 hypothetical protein [Flavobacterium columnare]MCH4832994.1 hypothetical protein [Flavobacterium columnare]